MSVFGTPIIPPIFVKSISESIFIEDDPSLPDSLVIKNSYSSICHIRFASESSAIDLKIPTRNKDVTKRYKNLTKLILDAIALRFYTLINESHDN